MVKENGLSGRKYEFLEHLSTESLEDLLRLSSGSVESEAFLDAVTEVIIERERRCPTGRIPSVDTAWRDFQTKYNTPDHLAQMAAEPPSAPSVPAPRRSLRRFWRLIAVVAATVALSLACMIGVQAAGVDVFGALARWTAEAFHYVLPNTEDNPIRAALREQEMPEELAPTYIPEGFELWELVSTRNDENKSVAGSYTNGDCDLSIEISQYNDPKDVKLWDLQKDSEEIQEFMSYERKFYILSNLETTTATWSDGQSLVINIWGDLSETEMKSIIGSIGG